MCHVECTYMCFILCNVTDYEQSVYISVLRLVVDVWLSYILCVCMCHVECTMCVLYCAILLTMNKV